LALELGSLGRLVMVWGGALFFLNFSLSTGFVELRVVYVAAIEHLMSQYVRMLKGWPTQQAPIKTQFSPKVFMAP